MPKAGNLNISVIANEKTNSDNFPLGPIRQFHRIWIPHEYHCDRCRHNCRIRMLKYRISVVIMNNTMPSVASLWLLLKKIFQKLVLVCWVWITHESHGWLHCGDCCHQNCKILIKTGQLSKIIEIGERHYRSIEFIYNFHSNHIAVRTLLKVWEKSVRNQNSRTNKRIIYSE